MSTGGGIISFKAYVIIAANCIPDVPLFLLLLHPQEFSFPQVWCSNQQPLYCAFSLERYSPATAQLSCKISVRQVKGHEQILQVYTAVAEVRLRSCGRQGGSTLCFLAQPLCNLPRVCPPTAGPALLSLHCVLIESRGHTFLCFFTDLCETQTTAIQMFARFTLYIFLTFIRRVHMFQQITRFTFTCTNTWELPSVTAVFCQPLSSSTGAVRS